MRPAPQNISKLFNKFAGKELKDPNRVTCDIDTTLEEMRQVANDNGLTLRVWFPGRMGTADYRLDRVNVHVEEGADGKLRVGKKFSIG